MSPLRAMRAASRLSAGEVIGGLRFTLGLPLFLRHTISPAEARAIVIDRTATREASLLAVLKRLIYDVPASPYHRLLRLAGCEYGDVVKLVTGDGVEGALAALYRQGVYLTVDEMKGYRPTVRGSASIGVVPPSCKTRDSPPQSRRSTMPAGRVRLRCPFRSRASAIPRRIDL